MRLENYSVRVYVCCFCCCSSARLQENIANKQKMMLVGLWLVLPPVLFAASSSMLLLRFGIAIRLLLPLQTPLFVCVCMCEWVSVCVRCTVCSHGTRKRIKMKRQIELHCWSNKCKIIRRWTQDQATVLCAVLWILLQTFICTPYSYATRLHSNVY